MSTNPTKAEKAARKANATEVLHRLFPKGSTVHTIVTRVSASGMSRNIMVFATEKYDDHEHNWGEIFDVSWAVAAVLDWKFDQKNGGVKVGGCGMDMAFHLVYELSAELYGDGYALSKRGL